MNEWLGLNIDQWDLSINVAQLLILILILWLYRR